MHNKQSRAVFLTLGFVMAACAAAQEYSDTGILLRSDENSAELIPAPPIPADALSLALPEEAIIRITPETQTLAAASITWFHGLLRNGVSVDTEEEARRFDYLYGLKGSEAFEFKSMISDFMRTVHEQDVDARARACRGFQDAVQELGEAAALAAMFDLLEGRGKLEEPYLSLIEDLTERFGSALTAKLHADIENSMRNKVAFAVDLRKYLAARDIDGREHIEKTVCRKYL